MPKTPDISPNDKDLILAKQIGRTLPDIDELDASSDPLLSTLLAYKTSSFNEFVEADTASIWNAIYGQINPEKRKGHIFSLSPKFRGYAIAATILLAAFLGIFLYQNLTQPRLIAESKGSSKVVTLADGSEVTLRPYSELYSIKQSAHLESYKLKGEAYFKVVKHSGRTFTVRTDLSEVRVLGTRFVLSNWGNASTVYLQEGRIQYTSLESRESVEVYPGQSSTIDQNNKIQIEEANETQFTDWLNDELVFENKPVREVFSELGQHFNIRVTSDQSILNENLSGSIPLDDLDSVLKDLELVLDGTFSKTGPTIYSFTPN